MKVVVGFLHRAEAITPLFRKSLTMLLMRDARTRQRIVGEIDQESSANISAGRCNIVRRFLEHPSKPDWLWMVDSDMTFGDDILDRLLRSADERSRPIMGGLCFGLRPKQPEKFSDVYSTELEAFPTLYRPTEDGGMLSWWDYPRDEVVQVFSTGAACLLLHRDVLADRRWVKDGHPLPWFRESVAPNGLAMSEDQNFCVRAGALGYPVHVDTGARTGHVKPLVIDEKFYDEHRAPKFVPTP